MPKLEDMRKSDLGDVNAIVSGYMLVANPSCNGEAEALAALDQLHLERKVCESLSFLDMTLCPPPL